MTLQQQLTVLYSGTGSTHLANLVVKKPYSSDFSAPRGGFSWRGRGCGRFGRGNKTLCQICASRASRISSEPFDLAASSSPIKSYQPFEQGGIGIVFKGWIDEHTLTVLKPGSRMVVPVEWNHGGPQEHQEWLKVIKCLRELHHPNLVKLIGYCLEEDNMILVYYFVPTGSLDNHLLERGHQSISWETRIKVAIDAARV